MASRRMMASAGLTMACVACAVAAKPPEPGFWLTGLQPEAKDGQVRGLNQDGSMAAGTNTLPASGPGFTWTQSGGRFDFGSLPGMPIGSSVTGLSDTGVVVGGMSVATGRAYRWTGTGPLQDLGLLPGETRSVAWGVNGDGTVVVGHAEHGAWINYTGQAFRWMPAKGLQGLGYAKPWDILSIARAVSRDGKTIVGISGPIGTDAFVWTEAGGMKILPKLPGAIHYDTYANAVNLDGSIVVGSSPSSDGYGHAVRWLDGKVEDLTVGSNFTSSLAFAVSDDGQVVGGAAGSFAFVWTPSNKMMLASDYLSLQGVQLPAGYKLEYVYAISGDGLTVGGAARNLATKKTEGFVATVPASGGPCKADCDATGTLDIDDFVCFQTFFAIGDPAADCDATGQLNIDDFICFQTYFAIGC